LKLTGTAFALSIQMWKKFLGFGLFLGVFLFSLWHHAHVRILWAALEVPSQAQLSMPVLGMRPSDVVSQWQAPRSGGRKHQGVDLFAQKGTAVLSATNGIIWRVGEDSLGGNVVSVLGDGRAIYYYAHLDSFNPDIKVGNRVTTGTQLGTVGNTGNAKNTPSHLHFGVYKIGCLSIRAVDPAGLLKRKQL
jgi:peptidoglycan LD-endopeptidase LytH